MRLIKEVCPSNPTRYPRRYLLLAEVSDEDARILELCNMVNVEEFDEGENEAWMVMP